jgi:hypothetical protein
MEVKRILIENFKNVGYADLQPGKVTYLTGNNGQGKSTIGVDAIYAAMQGVSQTKGKSPHPLRGERQKFIGKQGSKGEVSLVLYDRDKDKEYRVTRTIKASAQELRVEDPEGKPLSQEWLNEVFNNLLVNPKDFWMLPPKEQALMLGIDTSEYDSKIEKIKQEGQQKRKQKNSLKFEPVDAENPPEAGDPEAVRKKFNEELKKIEEEQQKVRASNDKLREQYEEELTYAKKQKEEADAIENMLTEVLSRMNYVPIPELEKHVSNIDALSEQVSASKSNIEYPEEPKYYKEPTISSIQDKYTAKIEEEQEKANQYEKWLEAKEKQDEAAAIDNELTKLREQLNKTQTERAQYIAAQMKGYGIKKLSVNDKNELEYDGRYIQERYFSKGELIVLTVTILAKIVGSDWKYVFIEDFSLLDENYQQKVVEALKDFQLIAEITGEKPEKENAVVIKGGSIDDVNPEKIL